MRANDIDVRKRAMRILFADELAEKDKENKKRLQKSQKQLRENKKRLRESRKLKSFIKINIKKLENIKDINSPEAKKIMETLMSL